MRQALKRIRLFATDVDGVLTDGGMYYAESGDELKKFNTRDGMGIKLLQRAGLITALITQEETKLVARRGEKLAIPEIHQRVFDKLSRLREIATRNQIALEDVAYMGDDVNDLETLQAVGFSATPADGIVSVRKQVDYVCRLKGGEGAVREVADMILAAQVGSSEELWFRTAKPQVRSSRFENRRSQNQGQEG
ncbi:MAG TPA: HAD hydrolase family protein [Nitrospiraceae bacterium]|nr:HAD hydrolase family protein [Nitrospiraceae bacterium]